MVFKNALKHIPVSVDGLASHQNNLRIVETGQIVDRNLGISTCRLDQFSCPWNFLHPGAVDIVHPHYGRVIFPRPFDQGVFGKERLQAAMVAAVTEHSARFHDRVADLRVRKVSWAGKENAVVCHCRTDTGTDAETGNGCIFVLRMKRQLAHERRITVVLDEKVFILKAVADCLGDIQALPVELRNKFQSLRISHRTDHAHADAADL